MESPVKTLKMKVEKEKHSGVCYNEQFLSMK